MKKYIVFIDYGTDGWSIQFQSDNWDEAVKHYLDDSFGDGSRLLVVNIDTQSILSAANPEGIAHG